MKIIIADDEKLARLRLKSLISELSEDMHVVAEVTNGSDALYEWQQTQADVMLLDIRMPDMDGLEVAKRLMALDAPVGIVFTTAYDEYALPAFDANAIDYLLKPIRKDRLLKALLKAQIMTKSRLEDLARLLPSEGMRTHLCVQVKSGLHIVPVQDIIYFQADQKYVVIKTEQREYLCEEPLKALEEEFSDLFIRVHRSALVARSRIQDLIRLPDGKLSLSLQGHDKNISVSRRLAGKVKACLKNN